MSEDNKLTPLRFGFRRRCAWCGVVLRGWQLNCCRRCKRGALYEESPWCHRASRWDDEPDRRRGAPVTRTSTPADMEEGT